jgi:hypothetical protein
MMAYQSSTQKLHPGAPKRDSRSGKTTIGTVRFLANIDKWDDEKPFCLTLPLPPNQPKSNVIFDEHLLEIHDTRGQDSQFALDVHGFSFATLPAFSVDMSDKKAVESQYLQQMEEFIREKFKANIVYAFDYTVSGLVRKFPFLADSMKLREAKARGEKYLWDGRRPPARNAHVGKTLCIVLRKVVYLLS